MLRPTDIELAAVQQGLRGAQVRDREHAHEAVVAFKIRVFDQSRQSGLS